MKAISLWQPWATLIAVGAKRLETRSWESRYQGELAIHAAKRWTADAHDLIQESPFREALQGHRMPRGVIVAVVRLTGCLRTARPCLTVNLLDQPIEQIITEARDAHLGLKVTPKAGVTTTPLSEVMNGLVRAIQVGSGAAESRLWALDRAVKSGRGNYRVNVTFASDRDTSPEAMFDLDIVVERILNQGTVYWDPIGATQERHRAAAVAIVAEAASPEDLDVAEAAERARRRPRTGVLAVIADRRAVLGG